MGGIRKKFDVRLPYHTSQLSVPKFSMFLTTHGAEILTTTNEWEVLRAMVRGQTAVLYKNKKGDLTWDSKLEEAFRAWKGGKKWDGLNGERVANRPPQKKKPVLVRTIAERDGDECWFCGTTDWQPDEPTLEHLLEISKGGGNHVFNLVLACGTCNKAVQHISIAEKVQYREVLRFSKEEGK